MTLPWLLAGIALAFDGLVMVAAITKYRQMMRARTWLQAPGRIVSSRSVTRKVERSLHSVDTRIEDTEQRNFAAITYAFTLGKTRHQGERVSIGEDLGNFRVAETLQRYPIGTAVTVFYNPADPRDCVLERDLSVRAFHIAFAIGIGFAAFVVAVFLAVMGMGASIGRAVSHALPGVPPGHISGAAFMAVMALLTFWFALVLRARCKAARHWPTVAARIVSSEADMLDARFSNIHSGWSSWRKVFRNRTIYAYEIAGIAYRSEKLHFGGQIYATFSWLARRGAARFTPEQTVTAYYDPDNPSLAVLEPDAPDLFVLWLTAATLLFGAGRLIGL